MVYFRTTYCSGIKLEKKRANAVLVLFIVVYTTKRVDCILFVLLALDIILGITKHQSCCEL